MKNHQEILEDIVGSFSYTIAERFCRRKCFIRFFESKFTTKKKKNKFSYDQVDDHFEFVGKTTDMIYDYYNKKYIKKTFLYEILCECQIYFMKFFKILSFFDFSICFFFRLVLNCSIIREAAHLFSFW